MTPAYLGSSSVDVCIWEREGGEYKSLERQGLAAKLAETTRGVFITPSVWVLRRSSEACGLLDQCLMVLGWGG